MPILIETKTGLVRRFRWSKLRYELGQWVFVTFPDSTLFFKTWEWEKP